MKLVTTKFKSGGLHEKHVVASNLYPVTIPTEPTRGMFVIFTKCLIRT